MKTRLISSAVGIVIAVTVFVLHNTFVLPLILAVVTEIILFELARAIQGEKFRLAMTGYMLYGGGELILEYFRNVTPDCAVVQTISRLLLPICLLTLFIEFLWHHGKYRIEMLSFMGGAMYFVPWSLEKLITLNYFDRHGLFYLILALCGAWIADSGAYFCGVALGKTKLCPNISPKKTVEGFVGGLISNAVVFLGLFWGYAMLWHVDFHASVGVKAALLGLVCAPISVVGDLVFSVIKREKGIKDYGKIMPGHGGLTDRFDSVLFVVPAFYLFVQSLPIFKEMM